jgi:hypothetical protein
MQRTGPDRSCACRYTKGEDRYEGNDNDVSKHRVHLMTNTEIAYFYGHSNDFRRPGACKFDEYSALATDGYGTCKLFNHGMPFPLSFFCDDEFSMPKEIERIKVPWEYGYRG